MEVTTNLYDALVALRRAAEGLPVAIWVDAICINQADVGERGRQVAIMRDIYSQADTVRAWLSRADDPVIRRGFEMFKILVAWRFREEALPMQLSPEGGNETLANVLALELLFRLPYWSRIWVIQELSLGKVNVLCCGCMIT